MARSSANHAKRTPQATPKVTIQHRKNTGARQRSKANKRKVRC